MKKILIFIPVTLIAVVIAIVFFANNLIKGSIEKYAPDILGTKVTVENVNFSLLSGKAKIDNFVIHNPEGFESEHSFSLKTIEINLEPKTIFGKSPLIINSILIDSPNIIYEVNEKGSNIGKIKKNISKSDSNKKHEEIADSKTEIDNTHGDNHKKNVFIKDLQLNNVKASGIILSNSKELQVPNIHLQNIGTENKGISFVKASSEIIGKILPILVQQNTNFLDNTKTWIKNLISN